MKALNKTLQAPSQHLLNNLKTDADPFYSTTTSEPRGSPWSPEHRRQLRIVKSSTAAFTSTLISNHLFSGVKLSYASTASAFSLAPTPWTEISFVAPMSSTLMVHVREMANCLRLLAGVSLQGSTRPITTSYLLMATREGGQRTAGSD